MSAETIHAYRTSPLGRFKRRPKHRKCKVHSETGTVVGSGRMIMVCKCPVPARDSESGVPNAAKEEA